MAAKEVEFRVTIKNTKPVELVDLGKSFEALGNLYADFVHEKRFEGAPGNAKLYVINVERGSIIADLKALLDQASFVYDHLDVLVGFMGNLHELIEFFRVQSPKRIDGADPTRSEAKQLGELLEPIAKDGSAQINLSIIGNAAPVTVNNVVVNSERANAIQNNVRRYLGPEVPESGDFEKEVFYLEQMRANSRSSVGDRGIIERYSVRPVKLFFMSPEVKSAIIDKPRNPFRTAYVVDGQVSTVRGEPALYKIFHVHEAFPNRRSTKERNRRTTKKKSGRKRAA